MSKSQPAAAVPPRIADGAPTDAHEFGVYVHIPFCSRRCDYCDFATWTDRHHLMRDYANACVDEIALARAEEAIPEVTSVFFGGGTPSLLPAADLCRILAEVDPADGAEVTVECNPENVTPELLAAYRAGGVNRISLGVQSMVPHVLASLGRIHRIEAVRQATTMIAAAGFSTFSVDLIYGAAAETDDDWRRSLDAVLSLDPSPPHVSAYALTVEPGTPLWRDPDRHPDDDAMARRYEIADEVLSAAGRNWYEISNWAAPDHECRHNQLYWRQSDYRGIGCAAHSHRDGWRFWNVRTPERYITNVAARRAVPSDDARRPSDAIAGTAGGGGGLTTQTGAATRYEPPALGGEERLDSSARRFEALELALRTSSGVPAGVLPGSTTGELDGLVIVENDRAVLTVRGRLVANEIAMRLDSGSAPSEAVPVRLIRDAMRMTEQRAPRL